ncbi:MAG: UvrD-helicase domain-containing protein [Nitrospinota bacterium]|nr:UvrD-helicase domain-containing protein [Nitrospinota bacterium]
MMSIGDNKEREQALDPSRSYIVQAPAGSGKTELLIQRYLKLMAYVEYPEQILAMTFTRKAAGEMKDRILNALANGLSDTPPDSAHEKRTWNLARRALERDRKKQWRILDNPARLKIQTIDSFCRSLTSQMPLLSGLGDPPPTEENTLEFYQEAARRTLRLAEVDNQQGEAVRTILNHLDNSKSAFIQGVVSLLEKRAQWLTHFFQQPRLTAGSKSYLEGVLTDLIESKLHHIRELFPKDLARTLPALAAHSAQNQTATNPQHASTCLLDLNTLPPPKVSSLKQWKTLAGLLLTDKGDYRKAGGVGPAMGFPTGSSDRENTLKHEFQELLSTLEQHDVGQDLKKVLNEVRVLSHGSFSEDEWNNLKAFLILLSTLEEVLRRVFRESGKTDFTEITLSALQALGEEDNPTDLLLKLDMKLQHILVDEYQDTSFKQHQLLEKLTYGWVPEDGRSLFIVGDPMQSIYRFRDAEVGLFLKAQSEGIGKIKLETLTLKTNFRSQKKLVAWVNECFAEIFPPADDPILGAVKYTEAQAAQSEEDFSGVVAHPVAEPKSGEEADLIAQLIREIRQQHSTASIAVLVRARAHLKNIVLALQNHGIPFQAEEIYPLSSRPAILDLLALTQSLVFQQDRLSWLSILRAPWCGLSLADLHQLCHDDASSPLWNLLNDPQRLGRLSADGQARIRRFVPIMHNAREACLTANIRERVEGCWIALGGPACVNPTIKKDIEVFFEKIAEITADGHFGRLQDPEKSLQNSYATAGAGDTGSVHIMTMHKAKGLEFDFVILPGLGKPPQSAKKRLLFWIPHGEDLLIAPIHEHGGEKSEIYDFLASLDKEKESLEMYRLLYVAATRAKMQLHLFGHAPVNKEGGKKPRAKSLLAKLWPYLEWQWRQSLPAAQEASATPTDYPRRAPEIKRLPIDFSLAPTASPGTTRQPNEPEFAWAGNQARSLGTVLHAVFQDLAGNSTGQWTDREASRAAFRSALLSEGLPPDHLEDALNGGMRAIENILQDETGRWILKKHSQQQSELSLTGKLNGGFENRIIDRTFIDENDIRWIIDYKTGEHQGTDLEGFFTEEKERYRRQLGEYEALLRQTGETRKIRKALYYPIHKRLVEITAE